MPVDPKTGVFKAAAPTKNFTPTVMTQAQANKNLTNHSLMAKAQAGKTANPTKGTTITPGGNAPTTPQVPAMSQYKAPDPFSFNYNYMTQDSANQQAEQQFNPLFEQAVKGVKAQQYQNTLDSGQSSAVRGLAHSGLAQDALTKIAIASQGQISGLNAQKMSDVARTAQEMLARDQARGDSLRAQQFAEYQSNRDFGYGQYRDSIGDSRYDSETAYNHSRDDKNDAFRDKSFDYQVGRDKRSDFESDRGFNYQVGRDTKDDAFRDKSFNYQVGRDKRGDFVDDRNFNYGKSQDALAESWRQKEWSQMSPAERQRESLNLYNSLKLKGGSGGGGGGRSRSSSSSRGSTSGGLTQKGPQQLDMDPNKLKAILDTMGKITPTYGTQLYYDKMKNLQY